jgi:hypothetical protein
MLLMPRNHAVNHGHYLERYFARKGNSSGSSVVGKGHDVEGKLKDGSLFPLFLTVNECVQACPGTRLFLSVSCGS